LNTQADLPVSSRQSISNIELEIVDRGVGKPILFLHGSDGVSPTAPLFDALAESAQLIAPFHPGFGHSALPDDVKTVDDIAYLYLDLLAARGLVDVTVVGASFGGWIAMEMAIRSTQRIGRIALVDTVGLRFGRGLDIDIADVNMLSPGEWAERTYFDPIHASPDLAAMTDDALLVLSRNRLALAQFTWSPYMHNPRLGRWLHRIDVPTLVLWGAQDGIVAPDYGRKLAAAIRGARFELIDRCGHYPDIEQPQVLARRIHEFVAAA